MARLLRSRPVGGSGVASGSRVVRGGNTRGMTVMTASGARWAPSRNSGTISMIERRPSGIRWLPNVGSPG